MAMDMGRVLVSGASGPIGSALLPSLRSAGYQVTRLVRGAAGNDQVTWDPMQPLDPAKVSGFDAVIHLAGESIVGRWTESKKRQIRESRSKGTRHLSEALSRAAQRPRVFVSGSAIGYYGDRGDELLGEDSASGTGFLAEVCREWEHATRSAEDAGIRTVHIRTGLVLSKSGGALPKMLTPFRLGLGGPMGDGRQWWSWIDVEDHIGAIHHVLQNNAIQGAINLAGPKPVTNAEFTKVLGSALSRPAIFPVPSFAVRLAFGQMGDELLLASQRVEPAKLIANGFSFWYPDLRSSLDHILRSPR
ncbi:MAG TPA: TIGR01777 family oxidoreductase [Terriglobales bacterium]